MAEKNRRSLFGPGFLVTAAFIGPGTVTTCSLAGANFGYTLIFALIFATLTTLILQEMTGRLSLGSNKDLGENLRDYPGSHVTRFILVILTLSAITIGCAAYEAGNIIGGSLGLEMISSFPQKLWVILMSIFAFFILSRKKQRIIEKILISLVFFMSIAFLTTFIIIRPDIPALLKGFIPTFPNKSSYLILALIGTTVVPYNLFLHSSVVKQKWKTKASLKDMKKDLLISITLGGIISVAIVVTSAVAFYSQNLEIKEGVHLAQQLKPLFGSFTNILFGLGFFAAGMSSAITAPYAAAYASSGIMGWEGGHHSPKFKGVWMGVLGVGLIVSLFNFNPISVIIFAQIANGLVLPVASIFLLIVLNDRNKMGGLANNLRQNIISGFIIIIVSFLGIWSIIKLFL